VENAGVMLMHGRAADPQPTRSSVVIMSLATRFTELAGCAVPIQQAPMGSVSTG
jgi:hypothetical protein